LRAPFKPLDAGEAAIEGAGLALAISKRLIEAIQNVLPMLRTL
jgi:hypothetical protein